MTRHSARCRAAETQGCATAPRRHLLVSEQDPNAKDESGVLDMSGNELNQVMGMDGEERYDYVLSQVVEERGIWILVNILATS